MTESRVLIWTAIALILATGLIHLIESPHHFEEATYVGVLFVLNTLGSVVAAIGIFLRYGLAWLLGSIIALGSIVGYFISRTIGLPGEDIHEWDAIGIVSLVVEGAFVLVYAIALARRS